jgi:RNA polymerase sigma factor (sigma-70 family)
MADSPPPAPALDLLYTEHHPWLLDWLRRKLKGAEHAADLTHDAFVRVLCRRENLATLDEPRAWLLTIARGLLIDHWRRQDLERAWREVLASRPELVEPSPEYRMLLLEALQALHAMIARMPPQVRRAFLLAQVQGMKYREIADRMDVSERMVKKYMAQAMLHCIALDTELSITETLASDGQHG